MDFLSSETKKVAIVERAISRGSTVTLLIFLLKAISSFFLASYSYENKINASLFYTHSIY